MQEISYLLEKTLLLDIRCQSVQRINGRKKNMVKSTGIVRKVDELGRIVIPIELRRTLDIGIKDSLEIYVEDDQIILKKYTPACAFCANASGITIFKGKNICSECLSELSKLG